MKISPNAFFELMKRAYAAGYEGENKDSFINSVVSEFGVKDEEDCESDFRIYSLEELRNAPVGATFLSEPLGPFKIQAYNGVKICIFPTCAEIAMAGLNCSAYPLDRGIRKISTEEFEEICAAKKATT